MGPPFSGSPLKNVTDMPPPASTKSSKLRESSVTRESSIAPSMDNESRMSVFSPEASPVSPTSSADSPSATSVKVTNGKNTHKSGAKSSIPTASIPPTQSNIHDASYMMMGKQIPPPPRQPTGVYQLFPQNTMIMKLGPPRTAVVIDMIYTGIRFYTHCVVPMRALARPWRVVPCPHLCI